MAPDYGSGPDGRGSSARSVPGDPEDRLVQWRGMHDAVEALRRRRVDLVHVQTPFVAHYAGAARRTEYRSGDATIPCSRNISPIMSRWFPPWLVLKPCPGFSRRQ